MKLTISPQNKYTFSLREIWEFKELLFFLAWRDIKVRYKQTIIGIFWAILQPLLTMTVFTFFFNKVAGISSGSVPYAVFSFTGLIFWNYFSTALADTSNSLIANQSIITKVFFPRIIIPISTSLVPLVDFLFAFCVLIVLLLFFHIPLTLLGIFLILPALFISFISALGLGNFLAILNVQYRDIRYALPFFIQLLLFITPVIYPISNLPRQFQLYFYINPLTGVIEVMRSVLLRQSEISINGILLSCISSIILFIFGITFFTRYQRGIADSL